MFQFVFIASFLIAVSLQESGFNFSLSPEQVVIGSNKIPLKPCLLKAEWTQVPQTLHAGQVLQLPEPWGASPPDFLQYLHFFSCIGGPKLDTILWCSLRSAKWRWRATSWIECIILIQPFQLALFAARVCYCFLLKLFSRTPLILFSDLLCRQLSFSLCCSIRLFHPNCETSFAFSEVWDNYPPTFSKLSWITE